MKPHARPMADYRRAQGIRYRAAVIRDAAIFALVAAALLAVATYSGPPPY
jgi:hypothetical protein